MEAYPLQWPIGYKRTRTRITSRFKTTMNAAQQSLRLEIDRMGGNSLIISTNLPIRKDGMLYSEWMSRKIDDPGVAIYFKYNGKLISMCCDQYLTVWENIYALSKGIEALRGMERWGVSDFIERAFTGFTALPSSIITPYIKKWWIVFGFDAIPKNMTLEKLNECYRTLAKAKHPDSGGSTEAFQELQQAFNEATDYLKS